MNPEISNKTAELESPNEELALPNADRRGELQREISDWKSAADPEPLRIREQELAQGIQFTSNGSGERMSVGDANFDEFRRRLPNSHDWLVSSFANLPNAIRELGLTPFDPQPIRECFNHLFPQSFSDTGFSSETELQPNPDSTEPNELKGGFKIFKELEEQGKR